MLFFSICFLTLSGIPETKEIEISIKTPQIVNFLLFDGFKRSSQKYLITKCFLKQPCTWKKSG